MSKDKKRRWFGTDGVRGVYGKEPMTESFVYRSGVAAARYFSGGSREFIIGRDTRESGLPLQAALKAGIEAGGGKVYLAGVLPTAAVAAFVQYRTASAGIMISASHNPFEDNGIKFFGSDGFKLADEVELEIESLIEGIEIPGEVGFSKGTLHFDSSPEAESAYEKVLLQSLPSGFSLGGLPIVADLANGAAWKTSPKILAALGAKVRTIAESPNGKNINSECGSLHTGPLQEVIRKSGGIGIAHDGDADRLIMVDETGDALDGDELMAIVALDYLREGRLAGNTLVATSMSNLGLDECLRENGGKVIRTDVGDRYVLEEMKRGRYNIGGEQSGHMLFLDHFTTGDGLLSALQVLKVVVKTGKSLRELRRVMSRYPQLLKNMKVKEKRPIADMPDVLNLVTAAEQELGSQGRVMLRYSGTENKIRLLLEGPDGKVLERISTGIIESLQKTIGA